MRTITPMRRWAATAALTLSALALAGCQTMVAPVEVTRFHLDVPPTGAAIMVVEAPGLDGGSMAYGTYESAVRRELDALGYPTGKASAGQYLATVSYKVVVQEAPPRGSPVSVGVGGSTGSYGSGLGVGIGINLSGRPKDVIVTELSVRIAETGTGKSVWEGRATTQAREGTPAAQPGLAAAKLASALFKGYPGNSGETITVK